MNPLVLESLEVDPETVWRRVEFFESFQEKFGSRLERQDEWVRLGTAATSLRFAAQFAAMVDARRARSIISAAAHHYAILGLPYGHFLWSCFLDKDDALGTLSGKPARQLDSLVSHDLSKLEEPGPLELIALTYPVQQTYLFVAMSTHRELSAELRSPLGSLEESLLAHEAQPIGPQGVPIHLYISLAHLLQRIHERDGEARLQAISILASMGDRYGAAIEDARKNTYLWQNLQSPVDAVDMEIAGLALVVDRALREASLNPLDLEQDALRPLSPVARVPIVVALEMGEHRQPSRDI